MGEILGLGMTHYPGMTMQSQLNLRAKMVMNDPLLPEKFRNFDTWPEQMKREYADDEGVAHSNEHRRLLTENFRWVREELDAFNPDVVLVWGDDQYENFKEDIVPPFSVLAYEGFDVQPWAHRGANVNSWGEGADTAFHYEGARRQGRYLATRLLEDGYDVAYAYKPNHDVMPHAFLNTALYLDWDRKGLSYPILPFAINCYGRGLVHTKGRPITGLEQLPNEDELDPPTPQPWRCFDTGAAIARAFRDSPWRVALVASSSWSHNFLTARYSYFHPDVETDKRYFEALKEGNYSVWRETPLAEIEQAGHNELLNWYCLAGAMNELNRKPQEARFIESWTCNSDKVFAVWRP